MMKTFLPALALVACLSGPAGAQEAPRDVHVSYADINLRSSLGVQILDKRIARAVVEACSSDSTNRLERAMDLNRCHDAKSEEAAIQRARVLATISYGEQAVASAQ